MAAKLLHTLADDSNFDLQKKIGCMNGIFQIFDRQHVLTTQPKSLTLGDANLNSIYFERDSAFQFKDSNIISKNATSEKKVTKVSTESSKVSFSSSCSSSSPVSSELNREAQSEISAYDCVIFPESLTNDPVMMRQGSESATHMELDLRDVVRDSMYREARGISQVCRHKIRDDSPRPYGLKQSTNESCKDLAKLRKTTSQHYYNEVDLKDASRCYVASRDKSKSKKKLKDLPKLSLDRSNHIDLKLSESFSRSSSMNKVSGSSKRLPSVVAKLMGLETLPGSPLGRDKLNSDPFSRSLRDNSLNRTIRFPPSSPRSLVNDLASSSSSSPRWRSSEFFMKPLSSLRFPIEPAPWKQTDKSRFSQKEAFRPVKALSQSMEGRLKDIEFKHSGKELRALKEILEAMESKGVFETRKQPRCSNLEPHRDYKNADVATSNHGSRSLQNRVMPTAMRGPIVIMKPARLVEQSGIPSSSLIPIHSLSSLGKNCRRSSTSRKVAKDRSSGNQRAESSSVSSVDNKSSSRIGRSSQITKERISKKSGSAGPRLHQWKKHDDDDKRSRPPTTPSDSRKSRRQTNRQPEESTTSPGGKRGHRAQRILQQNDDKSRTETEATMTTEQATETSGGKSLSAIEAAKTVVSNLMQNKATPNFSEEDGSSEHPSLVSVLNASIYKEIKGTGGNGFIDSSNEHCKEGQWNPAYSFSESATTTTNFSPEINRKKLQNVEHLVQKLKRLNSNHDEVNEDYIASLCENNDPNTDNRYISEILLASGLLLRDLGSESTTFQLHSSGHPINPELFLVLEQTKGSSRKSSNEKLNRKLVFDAVNETLVKKLDFVDPWMKRAKRVSSAQQLLKELCSEIETMQKQGNKRPENLLLSEEEQEEEFLKCILDEDMEIQSLKWTDFDDVTSGLVLDLERLIFKDLVSEIVHGEIGQATRKNSRR